MIQLNDQEISAVTGSGISEAACMAGFGALGALGGMIGGGIATAGVGMGVGAIWGFGFGVQIGGTLCIH